MEGSQECKFKMSDIDEQNPASIGGNNKKQEVSKFHVGREGTPWNELWTDGLICAFEFVRGCRSISPDKSGPRIQSLQGKDSLNAKKQVTRSGMGNASLQNLNKNNLLESMPLIDLNNTASILGAEEIPQLDDYKEKPKYIREFSDSHWVPIGWARISELVQTVQADASWASQQIDITEDEDDFTVADVAAPYWERPAGPTWWCHVTAGHPSVDAWLSNAPWLHPAISIALRDESRLISERMKHLLYEVPVRVAGGLLFELLGQSVGDPFRDEDDIPIVLRSWQARNFLITALHVKGSASNVNVLGITEVQELLLAGGSAAPKSVHEVIAHLTCHLSRWDDRNVYFHSWSFVLSMLKGIFFIANQTKLLLPATANDHTTLVTCILGIFVILNIDTYIFCFHWSLIMLHHKGDPFSLSFFVDTGPEKLEVAMQKVIRVKWSLHAREEIVFELLQHLRGNAAKNMLEGIKKSTREMLEEQEAVRGRLFTIQDVMQSTVRAWLQDRSLRVTHNLAIFGGCGLVLSIITGLFGINVDGIPGAENTPYAFSTFAGVLFVIGIILIGLGLLYLGLQNPITEEQVEVRKLELQQLVSMFQHDAETHAKVRDGISRHNLPPTAADMIAERGYVLIA
ncbi:hypothetical protein COCNU_06G007000 [Cocos nucifera]|uniref:Magnesium transporter CorA-like family protein n=1 Tax=Cocos nucifera TaxID=13894 RepID=A0A8K0IAV3_COCNU|nr:hypothetical protein COCNU_06G007000 [Cocos nucifera]